MSRAAPISAAEELQTRSHGDAVPPMTSHRAQDRRRRVRHEGMQYRRDRPGEEARAPHTLHRAAARAEPQPDPRRLLRMLGIFRRRLKLCFDQRGVLRNLSATSRVNGVTHRGRKGETLESSANPFGQDYARSLHSSADLSQDDVFMQCSRASVQRDAAVPRRHADRVPGTPMLSVAAGGRGISRRACVHHRIFRRMSRARVIVALNVSPRSLPRFASSLLLRGQPSASRSRARRTRAEFCRRDDPTSALDMRPTQIVDRRRDCIGSQSHLFFISHGPARGRCALEPASVIRTARGG